MSSQPLERAGKRAVGVTHPRIAPPVPLKGLEREYLAAAKELKIELMPWQRLASRYITALAERPTGRPRKGSIDHWKHPEVCIVVARQNGKTELLLPRILMGLRAGRRMLHTAQNRILPRELFMRLAADLNGDPDVVDIRFANGQEVIRMANGGRYSLVAPRPAARGNAVDDVFLDEVREQRNFDLIAAIKPTMAASRNPQIIYLSNAGDEDSVVLNDLRRRAETDPRLAYLEWSAAPERELDDVEGWKEANPALGITIDLATIEDMHRSLPAPVFETEHLCRWVATMAPRLISVAGWENAHAETGEPVRPTMGVSMDLSGTRASAVLAWRRSDGTVGLRLAADVRGEPIDIERLGPELRDLAIRLGVRTVVFDPYTDADLARYFRKAEPMNGIAYANACERFVRLVEGGRLRWEGAEAIGEDLTWTGRKTFGRGWIAVRTKEDHPVTSVLAAIRAAWEPSESNPSAPRVF